MTCEVPRRDLPQRGWECGELVAGQVEKEQLLELSDALGNERQPIAGDTEFAKEREREAGGRQFREMIVINVEATDAREVLQDVGDSGNVVGGQDEARQVREPRHLDGHVGNLVLKQLELLD